MGDTRCIKYSEDLEELAYHKETSSVKEAADVVVEQTDIEKDFGYERFFEAGVKFSGDHGSSLRDLTCLYITLHDDGAQLLFFGTEQQIFDKVRLCEDRESD